MHKPPVRFVAISLELIRELDSIRDNCIESFDSESQAARENIVAIRSGIDPKVDLVSIPGVRHHLHLKLYAAREHLLSCLCLISSNTERTLVNSIQALTRSALEASVTCLWLCSNKIPWEERLRRFSQLHLKSGYTSLKESGIDLHNRPDPSTVAQDIILTLEECDTLIDEVMTRGWTCRRGQNAGKTPTISKWIRELPTYSDLMKEASVIIPVLPEVLPALYSISSRSVHTDPVTVAGGSTDEDELARMSLALGAITTALTFHGLAWKLFASWCSATYPEDTIQNRLSEMYQLAWSRVSDTATS